MRNAASPPCECHQEGFYTRMGRQAALTWLLGFFRVTGEDKCAPALLGERLIQVADPLGKVLAAPA